MGYLKGNSLHGTLVTTIRLANTVYRLWSQSKAIPIATCFKKEPVNWLLEDPSEYLLSHFTILNVSHYRHNCFFYANCYEKLFNFPEFRIRSFSSENLSFLTISINNWFNKYSVLRFYWSFSSFLSFELLMFLH